MTTERGPDASRRGRVGGRRRFLLLLTCAPSAAGLIAGPAGGSRRRIHRFGRVRGPVGPPVLLAAAGKTERASSPAPRAVAGSDDASLGGGSSDRLAKARRLLALSRISPSERLDRLESATVVPMGSYSLRFGGSGSLEDELREGEGKAKGRNRGTKTVEGREEDATTELRMADTFDSVDNPVDSKSLLPGGRWMDADGARVSASPTDASVKPSSASSGPKNGDTNGLSSTTASGSVSMASGSEVAAPTVAYDPARSEAILFRQPGKWLVRNVRIALPFGIWAAGIVSDIVLGTERTNRRTRAGELRDVIAGLGPAIIKAGQALASRPDLLPGEYLEELQKLQDDVPTFSNEIAFRIVESELGRDFDGVFELVEPEPVAAASIGQVYKARLRANGQTVAIKIQRPNTEDVVALDLYVLRWWGGVYSSIFSLLGRNINLQGVMDDFGTLLYGEIDYVAEAANARRFSELYAQDVAIGGDVFVPKVYSELTTRKVLTMEWVDGCRLTDSESLEEYELDRKKLVDTLVQCSLRQIMEKGFFHADPHGNLLATRDGRLCYLDFGMMSYAASSQRNGFLLAVVHIVNRDWSELVRVYQRLGFIPSGTDVRPIELALEDALPDVLNADISELNFKNVVGKLGDIMYTYPFSLPPFYISIIRCLGVLEGLAIQVDPKARIISEAYPYVASRVLTDDSQEELREALRRLIFSSDGRIRWERLGGLLDEAQGSSGFDAVVAADKLVDYVISSEGGERLLDDIADQIVIEADSLGRDTVLYIAGALSSLTATTTDDRAVAAALRSLVELMQGSDGSKGDNSQAKSPGVTKFINHLTERLPEPSPAMRRTLKLGALLGSTGASSLTPSANKNPASETADALGRLVPLARKLSGEPRVVRKANEVVARLSERLVSRSLRAAFGLPEPVFQDDDEKVHALLE